MKTRTFFTFTLICLSASLSGCVTRTKITDEIDVPGRKAKMEKSSLSLIGNGPTISQSAPPMQQAVVPISTVTPLRPTTYMVPTQSGQRYVMVAAQPQVYPQVAYAEPDYWNASVNFQYSPRYGSNYYPQQRVLRAPPTRYVPSPRQYVPAQPRYTPPPSRRIDPPQHRVPVSQRPQVPPPQFFYQPPPYQYIPFPGSGR